MNRFEKHLATFLNFIRCALVYGIIVIAISYLIELFFSKEAVYTYYTLVEASGAYTSSQIATAQKIHLLLGLCMLLSTLLLLFVVSKKQKTTLSAYLWLRGFEKKMLAESMFLLLIIVLVYHAIKLLLSDTAPDNDLHSKHLGGITSPYIVVTELINKPLTEEMLFRGLFTKKLTSDPKQKRQRILLTSLLYTMVSHAPTLLFAGYVFSMNMVLSWWHEKSKSLLLPITLHLLINAIGLVIDVTT